MKKIYYRSIHIFISVIFIASLIITQQAQDKNKTKKSGFLELEEVEEIKDLAPKIEPPKDSEEHKKKLPDPENKK